MNNVHKPVSGSSIGTQTHFKSSLKNSIDEQGKTLAFPYLFVYNSIVYYRVCFLRLEVVWEQGPRGGMMKEVLLNNILECKASSDLECPPLCFVCLESKGC